MMHEASVMSYTNRGLPMPREGLADETWLQRIEHTQAHHSVYGFEASALEPFLAKEGALQKAFDGKAFLPELPLDFDGSAVDIASTAREVRYFVRWLIRDLEVPEEYIKVWFSGSKGYHVCLDGRLFKLLPSVNVPYTVMETVKRRFKHPLIDTSPLRTTGLIRAPWSKHLATGAHKVLIPLPELFGTEVPTGGGLPSIEERIELMAWPEDDPDPVLRPLIVLGTRQYVKASDSKSIARHDPTTMVTCMQKLLVEGPTKGQRHKTLLRLASWLWRSGLPEEQAVAALDSRGWLETSEIQRIVRSTYENGYAYGCNDEVMLEYCDERCVFHPKKNFAMDVQGHSELGKHLERYAEMLDSGEGFDLFDIYHRKGEGSYKVLPYHLMLIVADTGIGKSLWVQDLLRRLKMRTLLLNLEMPEELMVRRQLQSEFKATKGEVMDRIRHGDTPEMLERISWLKMISDTPNLETVERAVQMYKPKILVVDTTDGIAVTGHTGDHPPLRKIMEGLRMIARRNQCIVIAIHHINKGGSRAINGEEVGQRSPRRLSLNDPTGDRSTVTKVDHVLALEGERENSLRFLSSLKARDDEPIRMPLIFDFEHMRVFSPSKGERPDQSDLFDGGDPLMAV